MNRDRRDAADPSGQRSRTSAVGDSARRSARATLLLRQFFADLTRDMGRQVRCRHGCRPHQAGTSTAEDDDFMPLPW